MLDGGQQPGLPAHLTLTPTRTPGSATMPNDPQAHRYLENPISSSPVPSSTPTHQNTLFHGRVSRGQPVCVSCQVTPDFPHRNAPLSRIPLFKSRWQSISTTSTAIEFKNPMIPSQLPTPASPCLCISNWNPSLVTLIIGTHPLLHHSCLIPLLYHLPQSETAHRHYLIHRRHSKRTCLCPRCHQTRI